MPSTIPISARGRPEAAVDFQFRVEFDGLLTAAFTECSGLGMSVAIEKYEEGGLNEYVHQLPGRTTHTNITLKHVLFADSILYGWLLQVVQGQRARRNVTIQLVDALDNQVTGWQLKNAIPVKWTAPALKTDGNGAAIETIEIAHEGLVQI